MINDLVRSPAVWLAFGLILGVLELLLPGFVLIGFGIGAAVVSGILFLTGPSLFDGVAGIAYLASLWAVASLVAWFALRRVPGVRGPNARRVDMDINDAPYKGDRD